MEKLPPCMFLIQLVNYYPLILINFTFCYCSKIPRSLISFVKVHRSILLRNMLEIRFKKKKISLKSNFEEVRFFLNFYNFKSFKRPPPQIYLMSGKLAVIMLRYFLFCQRTEYLLQISQHPSTIYYFFNSA